MPFYRSEIIPNTIDPTFRVLDTSQWSSWYDGVQTEVVVRLWARHSFPESATQTGEQHHDATNKAADDQDFELVIEWHVDLNALSWIGKVVRSCKKLHQEEQSRTYIFLFSCKIFQVLSLKIRYYLNWMMVSIPHQILWYVYCQVHVIRVYLL